MRGVFAPRFILPGVATTAVTAMAIAPLVLAHPEGAPWSAAGDEGCAQCHFDAVTREDSAALSIEGLPQRVTPGGRYPLLVRLEDEHAEQVGFLLSISHDDHQPAGEFTVDDTRGETNGAQADRKSVV